MISTHDVFGKPRVYKNREMFPIQLRDADEFYASVQCLLIPKNVTNDVRLLQMSYLKYLAVVALQEESIMEMLMKLTKLIFKWESFDVYFSNDKDGKIDLDGVVTIMLDEGIEGREMRIHERDFDKIKTIICEQNLVDLDDKYVNPEVQAKIDESRKFLSKENKSASFEEQIIAYHCMAKIPYKEIEELTLYQFQKGLTRFDHILAASAIMNARFSGQVEFKDESKIPHWLGHIEESKDDPAIIDADNFKQKAIKKLGMAT